MTYSDSFLLPKGAGNLLSFSTPEENFIEFTKQAGTLTEPDIKAVFDKLQPVKPDVLIGEWKGGSLDTGHPAHAQLKGMNWLGKTFHSTESVDPIVIDKDGRRACNENWGHARLRQIEFRGVQSTAMIYDNHPIIDHFRRVSDDLVAGAMDTKSFGNAGTYYFYLYK